MKISFVVPAYNEQGNIAECLSAIRSEIERTELTAEILVVNNASTDRTGEIASSFGDVRVVDEPHKGLVWARKAGFDASSGDIIANIDADTRMPTGWLTTVSEHFWRDPELLALSGPHSFYDSSRYIRAVSFLFYVIGYAANRINAVLFKKGSMLQGGNYVVRRSAMEAIGGYDTSISFYGEDVDIGRRISAIGKVVWTFKLTMNASGRRLQKEGIFTMGCKYGINYLWVTFSWKPFDDKYRDIRI